MLIRKYKKVFNSDLEEIIKEYNSDYDVNYKIARSINDNFDVYKSSLYDKNEKTNIFWRLTFPFWLIYFILLFISLPLKWFLTGKGGYNQEDLVVKFLKSWNNKLNIDII